MFSSELPPTTTFLLYLRGERRAERYPLTQIGFTGCGSFSLFVFLAGFLLLAIASSPI